LEEKNLLPDNLTQTKVLVTIFSKELKDKSLEVYKKLKEANIACEIYLDENAPLDKQLKYADKKKIPYSIIVGPKEVSENKVTVKDMKTGEQKTVKLDELKGVLTYFTS